jgi:hypothetical protein
LVGRRARGEASKGGVFRRTRRELLAEKPQFPDVFLLLKIDTPDIFARLAGGG